MKRLPQVAVLLIAVLLMAADEKPEKAKEPVPSAAQIQLWVKQLGDSDFKVREAAVLNLIKAGDLARIAVTKATKIKDSEVAVNFVSGTGKEHMALLSALLKLGIGIRLLALTKEGVTEI